MVANAAEDSSRDRGVDRMSMGALREALPVLAPLPAVAPVMPYSVAPGGPVVDQQYETQVRLLNLILHSGYEMVQCNGQRRTGPPRTWTGPPPGTGCEIFIGKIPRDLYEDELFPLLMKFGRLYELRLMMDFSGTNRGFGFAQYSTPEEARRAVEQLDGYAIRPNKYLGVMKSLDNRRLFVGGLPKDKTRDEIFEELDKMVSGIVDVILYSSVIDKSKNRGFAFVEFESHRVAAIARRKMIPGGVVLWDHELAVDWAEPEPEVPDQIMSKVKVLYMRNLMLSTPEAKIREIIEKTAQIPKGAIEKVKKLKDFAFLHFTDRHFAELALQRLKDIVIDGANVTVVWAKPPRDRVMKSHKSLSRDSFSDDDNSGHGKPLLHDQNNNCISQPAPSGLWEALSAMCGRQEPVPHITSWPHPNKPNSLMFLARVDVPFLTPPFHIFTGNYAPTPHEAMESAAANVLMWMHRNGPTNTSFITPPMSPMSYLCQPSYSCF